MSSQCLTGFVPIITVVAGIAVASPAPKEGGKLAQPSQLETFESGSRLF